MDQFVGIDEADGAVHQADAKEQSDPFRGG